MKHASRLWHYGLTVCGIGCGLLVSSMAGWTIDPAAAANGLPGRELASTFPLELAQGELARVLELLTAGDQAIAEEQWSVAQANLAEALTLATAISEPLLQMRALLLLTVVETTLGDYDALIPHAMQLLSLAEAANNRPIVTVAYQSLGTGYFYTRPC